MTAILKHLTDREGRIVHKKGAQLGNQNAAKTSGELLNTSIHIACTPREKAAWMKSAQGRIAKWVRKTLNEKAGGIKA